MKKILLLVTILLFLKNTAQPINHNLERLKKQINNTQTAYKASSIINLKDSMHQLLWQASSGSWSFPYKETYLYNSAYVENASFSFNNSGSNWNQVEQTINYTFDSNNNLLSYTRQIWNGSNWINNTKTINTFDTSNNLLTELFQNWNPTTLLWENNNYNTYTYDGNHNNLSLLYQIWNTVTLAWVNSYKINSTYNSSNEYTSNSSQSWNSSSSSWTNAYNVINIVYSNGNLISNEIQSWNSSTSLYEPSYKGVISYDSNHHLLNQTSQQWNSFTSTWVNNHYEDYTYDVNGNQLTDLSKNWNTTINAWENDSQLNYYYTTITGIKQETIQQNTISLFPNPATDLITVSSIDNTPILEINVIDVLGKPVLSEKGKSLYTIDLSSIKDGIYSIELKTSTSIVYKKLIKE